jgi:hypothetical protein
MCNPRLRWTISQPSQPGRYPTATPQAVNGKTSLADLQAEVARLTAENSKLREARNAKLSLKVSEKGGLSCYGLGRFPVTLYAQQWTRLLDFAETIRAFIQCAILRTACPLALRSIRGLPPITANSPGWA